jgi:hypothetical protein
MTSGRIPAQNAMRPSGYQIPHTVAHRPSDALRRNCRSQRNACHSRRGRRESTRTWGRTAAGADGGPVCVSTPVQVPSFFRVQAISPHSREIPPETGGYSNVKRRNSFGPGPSVHRSRSDLTGSRAHKFVLSIGFGIVWLFSPRLERVTKRLLARLRRGCDRRAGYSLRRPRSCLFPCQVRE